MPGSNDFHHLSIFHPKDPLTIMGKGRNIQKCTTLSVGNPRIVRDIPLIFSKWPKQKYATAARYNTNNILNVMSLAFVVIMSACR